MSKQNNQKSVQPTDIPTSKSFSLLWSPYLINVIEFLLEDSIICFLIDSWHEHIHLTREILRSNEIIL